MIAKTTLDVRATRAYANAQTHTHDERAPISFFLETAVSPVEAIKVGASYAPMRLYFAFARSAAHSVIGVIDCYFSYLRSSGATRRWARVSMRSPARIRMPMEIAVSRDDFPDLQRTSLACYSRLRVAVDLHARRFISLTRATSYILIVPSLSLSFVLSLSISSSLFLLSFFYSLVMDEPLSTLDSRLRASGGDWSIAAPSLGIIK